MTGAEPQDAALIGQMLALASAASFAFANVFISHTRRSGGDKGVLFSVLVTMGMSLVLWLALEARHTGLVPLRGEGAQLGVLMFAGAGVMAMVFGRTLVFESIRRLGVTRSAAVKRLNPFFSVILAAILLSEPVTGGDVTGMVAIGLAFAILIRESVRMRGKLRVEAPPPAAYLFGVFGALAYALSSIGRKAGLDVLSAPAFGTFVSAVTGFAVFAALAVVSPRYRVYFHGVFRDLDRWIVLAAIMVSLGQVLLFAALAYETVTTVVMIASMEIFLSMFLSIMIFRTERVPGPMILLAAAMATVGVLLVAAN